MYAVMIQNDVTRESRTWAERDGELIVVHRTKKGAENALRALCDHPDPGLYANMSVQKLERIPTYSVERD